MKTFSKLITVTTSDLDELNHVNNVIYIQWANNIAREHWAKEAAQPQLENYFWVVLNHNIDYKNSALLNDVIQLKTYVVLSEGVTSIRIVEMYNNATQKLLAKCETKYCLIDANTKRPTRIPEEISTLFN